jgi:hypothetical protein
MLKLVCYDEPALGTAADTVLKGQKLCAHRCRENKPNLLCSEL